MSSTSQPVGTNPVQTNTKKPSDNDFKQQRLPAWQPILTAGTVFPTFFLFGLAFVPIGIGMFWFSDQVQEGKVDYTECKPIHSTSGSSCAQMIKNNNDTAVDCICLQELRIDEDWKGEVYMYYGLTNFYQNHRRYVKSRDDSQLYGNVLTTPNSDCSPFDKDEAGQTYVPCGAIANSLFSDVIELKYRADTAPEDAFIPVDLIRKGIAWQSDKDYKFKNPDLGGKTWKDYFKDNNLVSPKNWKQELYELDPEDESNNGLQNEDLIVWMRTAALPNFRKLYRKVNHTGTFQEGLPKGIYQFKITYRFEVTSFSGTKSVILSTTSLLGGKNPFLGIAYITVGAICLLMGMVFLFIHIKRGKPTSEMMSINARTPYNSE